MGGSEHMNLTFSMFDLNFLSNLFFLNRVVIVAGNAAERLRVAAKDQINLTTYWLTTGKR
jgi:hypothetical protein